MDDTYGYRTTYVIFFATSSSSIFHSGSMQCRRCQTLAAVFKLRSYTDPCTRFGGLAVKMIRHQNQKPSESFPHAMPGICFGAFLSSAENRIQLFHYRYNISGTLLGLKTSSFCISSNSYHKFILWFSSLAQ